MTEEEKIFDVGPGEVYEDDRSRMTIFFQVLGRKFWKLITVNLMFLLFNLPAIIISLVFSAFMLNAFLPTSITATSNELMTNLFVLGIPLGVFLMVIPIITVGPAQAGMTYLLRCYSYEMPTFTWSDFKDKMRDNIKQGLLVSIINLFAIFFLIYDLYLYSQLNLGSSILFSIANGLLIVVFLLFLMMSLYLYPMMVTYRLKTKHLYKNAFLFAFAKFLPNLGVLLINFALVLGPVVIGILTGSPIAIAIAYVFYFALGFALPGYIVNFFINPVIDKYLQPAPAAQVTSQEETSIEESDS